MERCTAVSPCSLLLVTLLLVPGAVGAAEVDTLVLVASLDANIPTLTPKETRKLYLGVPVVKHGQRLRPLRNLADPFLEEVFLQKVIFLSMRAYENQLLSRVFRMGGQRPESYENRDRLVGALHESLNSVTYMWAGDVERDTSLKKVGELWAVD